ncbi:protein OPAQUE1-like [Lucilia cuprina]|uniref:protein OPAQUE1-like n=1 Tax=Lucilia cuprina TaxID=7375 RepID=UPI001F071069|nr:protein OPAQUE1-like [Lucilia cuprina]
MPSKRKQKSRLNSLLELKPTVEILPNTINKTSNLTIKEEKSIGDCEEECLDEAEGYETMAYEESQHELKKGVSRTCLLLQDYLEFKAARCIQRYLRGWLLRTKYRRLRLAAIIIQREWRRFYCQRLYFRKVEETLQQRIEQHYYRAAQRIQALWRGWWVRHHIHDHTRLMRLQLMAGEDLLYCVAFKLHHLLRTHQIPGIYSLRNSSALSKVEQLLASLTFKACNQRSIQAKEQRRHEIEVARREHKKSAYGTKVPFSGPDIHNLCAPKCAPLYNAKDADMRISKILQMYEEANRELAKPTKLRKKSAFSKQSQGIESLPETPSFCGDVVSSMKKWKIITENNVNVDPNVFRNPQNVEKFLKEIESKMSLLQGNCYCRREFHEDLDKAKAKFLSQERDKSNNLSSSTSMRNSPKSILTDDGKG